MAGLKSHADALTELGLNGSADDEAIRQAFRQRLKRAHPDLNGGTDARLRQLILARDLLMSGRRNNPEDIEVAQSYAGADIPDDSTTPLTITLAQALFGGDTTAEVPALEFSHATENLTSLTQTKTLRLSLPRGLRDSERVCLPCEGAARHEMSFRINIEPEADIRVWGDDIWMTVRVESRLFQRGGDTLIETPHGPQEIKIDRGALSGASLCLTGKGLPATETTAAGNLHIRLEACPDVVRPVSHVLDDFRQRWAS